MRRYYPVFLDLADRPCLVVGGGKVAERKALALIRAGARVRVVSPTVTARLAREKAAGRLAHAARRFRPGDARGAFLVIAATDSREENEKVSASSPGLVNVVDTPELCSFIVPSTVTRGPLTIAISTSGASPALARVIRKELEAFYPPAVGVYLRKVARMRERAAREIPEPRRRALYLKSLASRRALRQLRAGRKVKPPEPRGK